MLRNVFYYGFRCIFANLRLLVMKALSGKDLRYSPRCFMCPSSIVWLRKHGQLIIGRDVRLGVCSQLSILGGAKLVLGNNVSIGKFAHIAVHEYVEIGENTIVGKSAIYDHDHDFRAKGGARSGIFKTSPVIIGKNVWIGDNVVILRGTTIGDNCVVGAGCVIRGNFPSNSIIVQKRDTQVIPFSPNDSESN